MGNAGSCQQPCEQDPPNTGENPEIVDIDDIIKKKKFLIKLTNYLSQEDRTKDGINNILEEYQGIVFLELLGKKTIALPDAPKQNILDTKIEGETLKEIITNYNFCKIAASYDRFISDDPPAKSPKSPAGDSVGETESEKSFSS
ncbi:hypothetical protein N9X24_01515 [Rickettsiales bacterium]|nr:hypothetical protein [Rickettsiales bacterium]